MLSTLFRISHKIRKFSFSATLPKLMPDIADFMTTDEAAAALGFTVVSVRNLIYKKKLESVRFGRSIFIPKTAIKDYIEKTAGMGKNDPRRNLK